MRLGVSACLVAGVLSLRRRLIARHPDVDGVLAVTLLLLTPMFMVPQALGQNSPLLFLSAALGLAVADRSRPASIGVGVLWALTVAFKLSPIVLVVVLVVRRRWTPGRGVRSPYVTARAVRGVEVACVRGVVHRAPGELAVNPYSNPGVSTHSCGHDRHGDVRRRDVDRGSSRRRDGLGGAPHRRGSAVGASPGWGLPRRRCVVALPLGGVRR
jgi:hypothetical protein